MSWRRLTAPSTKYKIQDDYTQKFNKFRISRYPLFKTLAAMGAIGVLMYEFYSYEYNYQTSQLAQRDYDCVKHNQQMFEHLVLSHMDKINSAQGFKDASIF